MEEIGLFNEIMEVKERVKSLEEIATSDWKEHVANTLDSLVGSYSKLEQELTFVSHRLTRLDDDVQSLKIGMAKILVKLEIT